MSQKSYFTINAELHIERRVEMANNENPLSNYPARFILFDLADLSKNSGSIWYIKLFFLLR